MSTSGHVARIQAVAGWVKCPTGRDELAAITPAQQEQLASGVLPCPACRELCRPTFEATTLREDMQLVRIVDGVWVQGFLLRL